MEEHGKLPWMKFNPQEFMGDDRVGRMTACERGIYISLLCDAWQGEPGIPDDPESLAFRCGATPDQMQEAWPKVRPCFEEHPERDGWLIHPRMEKDRQEALELKRKRREAGRKGARKRWSGEDRENGDAHDGATGGGNGSGGASANGGANGHAAGEAIGNRASGTLDSSTSGDLESHPEGEEEEREKKKGEQPHRWMHDIWHDELGYEGHPIKLTQKRRQKYRALYEEQLADLDDPRLAWRAILRCVQRSDHHMSKRSYQMPESILRNEERRERWVQDTLDLLRSRGGRDVDRKAERRRRDLARQIEARRSA